MGVAVEAPGVALEIRTEGLELALERMKKLSAFRRLGMFEILGSEVESQTKRRISDEKSYPASGLPWLPWSPAYAETRHAGRSLLQNEGPLLESIQHVAGSDAVETGSNLVYAAIHQFGGAAVGKPGLPAREYLGLSPENISDLDDLLSQFFTDIAEGDRT